MSLISSGHSPEYHQEAFEEAVSQALGWFEARHGHWMTTATENHFQKENLCHPPNGRCNNINEAKSMTTNATPPRLLLEFRNLTIGLDAQEQAEKAAARIRESVPNSVPVHLKLKCCSIKEGGEQVMIRFLSSVPNLTFIESTLLWLDSQDLSKVVSAATNLKELVLPLKCSSLWGGFSGVLASCGQLEELRLTSTPSTSQGTLDKDAVLDLLQALSSLSQLNVFALTSFRGDDEAFHLLVDGLLNSFSGTTKPCLQRLQIICSGGLTGISLDCVARLLRGLPASTQLSLGMRQMPQLFADAFPTQVHSFLTSLQEPTVSMTRLDLDNVGLQGSSAIKLLQALEHQRSPGTVNLGGPRLLRSHDTSRRNVFSHLVASLSRMRSVQRLSVIDTETSLTQVAQGAKLSVEQCETGVVEAVHRNPVLQHLSLWAQQDAVSPTAALDKIFQRNVSLDKARKVIIERSRQIPLSVWPTVVSSVSLQGGEMGADAVYLLLHFLQSNGSV